jgi:hypothetical protein
MEFIFEPEFWVAISFFIFLALVLFGGGIAHFAQSLCLRAGDTAPATERGRSRTRPPSLPDRTIHLPSAVCPVIMPTWWGQTTTAPTRGPDGRPQRAQFRARFISGPPPFWVLIHHPHQRAGLPPADA